MPGDAVVTPPPLPRERGLGQVDLEVLPQVVCGGKDCWVDRLLVDQFLVDQRHQAKGLYQQRGDFAFAACCCQRLGGGIWQADRQSPAAPAPAATPGLWCGWKDSLAQ
jgi:hypothetical protein